MLKKNKTHRVTRRVTVSAQRLVSRETFHGSNARKRHLFEEG